MNNLSNNFDNAYTQYADVAMFMSTPQIVKKRYPEDSFNAGYSSGRIFYYMLLNEEFNLENYLPVDPFGTLTNQQEQAKTQALADRKSVV